MFAGDPAPWRATGGNSAEFYVFVRSGSTWSQQATLTASDAAAGAFFGTSVAIHGSTALVGAAENSSNTGAAYVFAKV